jgi:hypothetical protein
MFNNSLPIGGSGLYNTRAAKIALAAAAGTMALLAATSFIGSAFAKISEVITDQHCENPAGNEPGGQQPECTGSGQTQITETENQNPSGAAPPGHNK